MGVLKILLARWKVIGQKIANLQARALLSLFYFVVLGPFALTLKVFADPLRLHRGTAEKWVDRPDVDADAITLARRQF
jgi:hypothetical protein